MGSIPVRVTKKLRTSFGAFLFAVSQNQHGAWADIKAQLHRNPNAHGDATFAPLAVTNSREGPPPARKHTPQKMLPENERIFPKVLDKHVFFWYNIYVTDATMAQSVEHVIGNDEVISSILISSSKRHAKACLFLILSFRVRFCTPHRLRYRKVR